MTKLENELPKMIECPEHGYLERWGINQCRICYSNDIARWGSE
jgi:hypothetical protein